MRFHKWMKKNTESLPRHEQDLKVLKMAEGLLDKKETRPWLVFAPIATALIVLVTIFNVTKINDTKKDELFVSSEPVDFIQNYSDIELMAEASSLNASDWEKIK